MLCAARAEAKQRSLWSKSFKALCAERKVSDDMRKLVESAFKPKEGDDGGVKKMIIAGMLTEIALIHRTVALTLTFLPPVSGRQAEFRRGQYAV